MRHENISLNLMQFYFFKIRKLMDCGKGVCLVSAASVDAFNNVILFCLVIGMYHNPLPERLLLHCSGLIFHS